MTSTALTAISARLYLSSNGVSGSESTITTDAVEVNYQLGQYVTDAVVTKADGDIRSFKKLC